MVLYNNMKLLHQEIYHHHQQQQHEEWPSKVNLTEDVKKMCTHFSGNTLELVDLFLNSLTQMYKDTVVTGDIKPPRFF